MLAVLAQLSVLSQNTDQVYTCMFYNVENLFHPSNDSLLTADDDFTPEGTRRWTWYRYNNKIAGICKVILAANKWEAPDLVCLCEIENRQVLQDIIRHPLLMNYSYDIIHKNSPDHRGMDVGMLFRTDRLELIDTSWLNIEDYLHASLKTRYILLAEFSTGSDTFLVAENHWVSKYGGSAETESLRISQAKFLASTLDSIRTKKPGYFIVAGGDFNDGSKEKAIRILSQDWGFQEIHSSENIQTYKYQGKWESIDHVFVSGETSRWDYSLKVLDMAGLFEPDISYTGTMPRRTYRGYAYNGGISDHLPILLEFLRVEPQDD